MPELKAKHAMRALSIRQPFANKILNRSKKVEMRKIRTNKTERVYIYASQRYDDPKARSMTHGMIVGTVEIVGCVKKGSWYHWLLSAPRRLARPIRPKGRPQPVWFIPFPTGR